ncbi:MAG: potassium-transporting ATPase subunit KdpA [Armatimonadetes bacterium]|nr:potassium-transporting ATPase subunit KdpA [Armatimonadota bacterium]
MLQIILYFLIILALTKPMGLYLAHVFEGKARWMGWLERPLYRLLGIQPDEDQDWRKYALCTLAFSAFSMLLTYGLLRMQGLLPLNPQGFSGEQMTPHLAFNTAASFMTNTNWQSYSPESTLSYFSNMVSLAIHNWASAAVGLAVAVALVRGLARKSAGGIGNFWSDVVRGTLYVLLPICAVGAIIFVASGVPQTFEGPKAITTIEGAKQTIALGPVASQEIIKQLGTNGGGFFNANSAHPFENPTPWADLFSKVLMFLIPAGLTYMFGRMVGNVRQGWAVFAAMSVLFLAGAGISTVAEQSGNPAFAQYGVERANMEGKEVRFGIAGSTLFASITTGASCGAVNSMHDSYTPIGGLVPLFNILTGEVIFGGVGAGLYGMLLFVILAVFIAGLMVGRTPEYLGKKIGKFEVQMAMIAVLAMAISILGMTALGSVLELPKQGSMAALNTLGETVYGPMTGNLNNPGPHGFTEMLYAFTSATGNNGSAFAGITANTPIYNTLLGLAMIIGRFLVIIPVLAIAGHMARKKVAPASAGTFPTDSATFTLLLVGVVVIVGALTFFPALALGPIVEHLQMTGGR